MASPDDSLLYNHAANWTLVWIYQGQFKKEKQEFVARKLDAKGWTKSIAQCALVVGLWLDLSVCWRQSSLSRFNHGCDKWSRANLDDGCLS